MRFCFPGILVLFSPLILADQPREDVRGRFKSPLGIVVEEKGQRAYVALHTADAVAVVDLEKGKVLKEIATGKGPHDVALAGDYVFVTCEKDDTLERIDLTRNKVTARWKVGQAPQGLVVNSDDIWIYVVCHDSKALHALASTGERKTLPLTGWPGRVVLKDGSPEGGLYVLSRDETQAFVTVIDPEKFKVAKTIRLADLGNPRGLAIKSFWPFPFLVAHQKPRTQVPATQVTQGWVFTNAVTFSPLEEDDPPRRNQTRLLDEPARGYADPGDLVFLPNGKIGLLACAGADTVLALGGDRFFEEDAATGGWGPFGPMPKKENNTPAKDDLTLSRRYIQARLPTGAKPRRLALSGDGKTLVVSNYLGDSLTVIDTAQLRVVRQISLGGPKPDAARRGEILFNSNRMTFHGQFTCASCHPNGGADGLNWDLSRDGIGNFHNTRSLLGVRDTAPYGWLDTSPTLADRVTGTLRTLHHHEPQGTETADLVAYLKTLDPPRPLPMKKTEAAASARGKLIFQAKGKCANCHRRPALDDDVGHDVGTRMPGDTQDRFDTPSLRGVARTAPYLHHGQARTLEEIFTRYNPHQRHGAAHGLTPAELADLIVFLKSL